MLLMSWVIVATCPGDDESYEMPREKAPAKIVQRDTHASLLKASPPTPVKSVCHLSAVEQLKFHEVCCCHGGSSAELSDVKGAVMPAALDKEAVHGYRSLNTPTRK